MSLRQKINNIWIMMSHLGFQTCKDRPQVVPLVVIFGQISMQEILVKNVKVGTIFEVGSSFGVI